MNERNRTSYEAEGRRAETQTIRSRRVPQGQAILLQSPMLTFVILFGLIFLLFTGLRGCAARQEGETEPSDHAFQTESDRQQTDTQAPATSEQTATGDVTTEPVTTEAVTTEPVTTVPVTTEPPGPVMMTVDDSYFADALFLGDSRTDGLYLYSTPGKCKHYPYPATSMTIFKIMDSKDEEQRYGCADLRSLLKKEQFGKIYLMFGINECGYNTNSFAEKYKSVVEEIRSYQPGAIIYIQSILYVTQKHEAKYPVFATANIKEKNEAIKALANDVDIFYLEVNDCLNDGTDHLPSDYTGDGAHLKAKYYRIWHDYLLEHAVVDAAHPWQPPVEEPAESGEGSQQN